MQHNLIGSLEGNSLRNLISMTHLNFYGNKLSSISNLMYWNFVRLSVGNNKLNTLSCSELPYNTYELDLSKNNISKIDSNCKHILGQIAILDLSCNQLVSNGINIQKDILEKLHFVVSLKLAGNNIAELQNPIRHFNLLNL
ncbi:hypothetical protein TrispH2_002810 [Trichoplax sp. H2]|nr:hypothetical protein TrispH2_002810 [Trichoplax sp. H2]|eukprot:RDD45689.1 hypothetical protein TrispH2_002810 [Trichoplax sp. H2]